MVHSCAVELTAEHAFLTAGTEHTKAQRDSFDARIREVMFNVVTRDGRLTLVSRPFCP